MPPDETPPQVDALGFAPTRIVEAVMSRHRFIVRFYRVWMKPDDLAFPRQRRRLEGQEHDDALMAWLRRPRSNRGRELRLDAGHPPLPAGVTPKKDFEPPGEVSDSAAGLPAPGVSPSLPAPGDWPEDFGHENGNYLCRCMDCGHTFTGYKRRVLCRICSGQPDDEPCPWHDDKPHPYPTGVYPKNALALAGVP